MNLDKLRALCEAATAGPWRAEDGCVHSIHQSSAGPVVDAFGCRDTDAAFIAAARTAVPELIGEVERMRALVTDMQSAGDETKAMADRDSLRAECERLKGKTLAPTEWIDKLTAQAEGRCLQIMGFVACGEGGNYCSVVCQLRARIALIEPVWGRAKEWMQIAHAVSKTSLMFHVDMNLIDAISTALAAEEKSK